MFEYIGYSIYLGLLLFVAYKFGQSNGYRKGWNHRETRVQEQDKVKNLWPDIR